MFDFNKNFFIKNNIPFIFDHYDLTREMFILDRKHKINNLTQYTFMFAGMTFFAGLCTMLPFSQDNIVLLGIQILVCLSSIYFVGGLSGLMLYDKSTSILNKFSFFKKRNIEQEKIKQHLINLCHEQDFQFSLLCYLKKISQSLDKFSFTDEKKDTNRIHAAYLLDIVHNDLKYFFSQNNYVKAVEILTSQESLKKINQVLTIQKDFMLEGINTKKLSQEAQLKQYNTQLYEESFNTFNANRSNKNNVVEVEYEKYL